MLKILYPKKDLKSGEKNVAVGIKVKSYEEMAFEKNRFHRMCLRGLGGIKGDRINAEKLSEWGSEKITNQFQAIFRTRALRE